MRRPPPTPRRPKAPASRLRVRPALGATAVVVVSSIVGVSVAAGGRDQGVPVALYLVCIGLALIGLALWWLLQVDLGDDNRVLRIGFRRERRPDRPRDLAMVGSDWEGLLASAQHSGRAATLRLVPRLQEITRARLRRQGIDLDADPAAAAVLLGAEPWALVDPGRARPTDRAAPGLDPDLVAQLVTRLEAL